MKRQILFVKIRLFLFVTMFCIYAPALGDRIDSLRPKIWGIDNSLAIPPGSIITEAVLTVHNITKVSENSDDTLYVRLLDDPPVGFKSIDNNLELNTSSDVPGVLLTQPYRDITAGNEDLVYTFSDLNDESSRLWNVFNSQSQALAGYSSSLLQLIDYAGNGTPFGLGFDPNATTNYDFETITLELTIESFDGSVQPHMITLTTSLMETIGPRHVDEGSTLTFDVITQSIDTVVSAQPLPAGASFSNNTFSWTPGYDQAGTYDVEFRATDGEYEDSQNVTLTVNNVPVVSSIKILGPAQVNENSAASYTCTATYDDGSTETVAAAWGENSGYASINNGVLTTGDVLADQQCTITASYQGRTDTHSVTITYIPALTSIAINGPTQVNENSTASYTCTATYDDGSTETVAAAWSENSGYASINDGVLTTGDVLADQQCAITASYQGQIDTHSVTITYIPVLTSIAINGPAQVSENSTASDTCIATYDDGSTETITAAWSENSGYASINDGVLTTGDVLADQQCTITASYQGRTDTHSVTITYIPALTSIAINGPAQVNENSTASYTCIATYDDDSTSIVAAAWGENSGYASINDGVLTTGDVLADQQCTITASYQGQIGTHSVTIVNEQAAAPVLAPIGDKNISERSTLTFEVFVSGENAEQITCSAQNLPAGATFENNVFTWRPWYGTAGDYEVTFIATDGNLTDSETITITVTPVKTASWYERWFRHLDLR
ncbi:MAG: Ig domain-containing protein [Planctomycetota bacterium]|jgi:hypothetical protein